MRVCVFANEAAAHQFHPTRADRDRSPVPPGARPKMYTKRPPLLPTLLVIAAILVAADSLAGEPPTPDADPPRIRTRTVP